MKSLYRSPWSLLCILSHVKKSRAVRIAPVRLGMMGPLQKSTSAQRLFILVWSTPFPLAELILVHHVAGWSSSFHMCRCIAKALAVNKRPVLSVENVHPIHLIRLHPMWPSALRIIPRMK
jgi:hypothetical protein